jgi:hypothetical protein
MVVAGAARRCANRASEDARATFLAYYPEDKVTVVGIGTLNPATVINRFMPIRRVYPRQ